MFISRLLPCCRSNSEQNFANKRIIQVFICKIKNPTCHEAAGIWESHIELQSMWLFCSYTSRIYTGAFCKWIDTACTHAAAKLKWMCAVIWSAASFTAGRRTLSIRLQNVDENAPASSAFLCLDKISLSTYSISFDDTINANTLK